MTDEPQPELRWAPREPKPSSARRVWLIVGLSVAVLAIVGALLFFLLPGGGGQDPDGTASPTPTRSDSPSPTASPSRSAAPTTDPVPTQTPITTPPPVADPSIAEFRATVEGWLDDALTGLDIVEETSGDEALDVIDTLEADAQRFAETTPPASVSAEWRNAADEYAQRLAGLRSAITSNADVGGALEAARSSAKQLRATVGL